jgi:peptidoglycan/xylan/chitin deacetylase (PgdA/CDA1 family)
MANTYATTARELERDRPFRFRARAAGRGLVLRALRALPREPAPGVRIVHYHYVFDDELSSFSRQLGYLADTYEPVSLSEAVARLASGAIRGRELVVTFDDGFRNQLRNAAPLLEEAGFRACFFLVTELLSASAAEAARICRERLHLPRPVEPLDWDDAGALLERGHEVGSHSRSHANLVTLDAAALDDELRASRDELERRLGRPVPHFSAPYGERHRFSPEISAAARAAGYASCATAQRGRNSGPADVFALRRDHLGAGWAVEDVRYFLSRP